MTERPTSGTARWRAAVLLVPLIALACGDAPGHAPSSGPQANAPLCVEACTHAESCDALDLLHASDVPACVAACNGASSAVPSCIRDTACAHLPLCVSAYVDCFGACARLDTCSALDEGGRDECLWRCERNRPDPSVLTCIANAPTCFDVIPCEDGPCPQDADDCLPHLCVDDLYEPNQDFDEATPLGLDGLRDLSLCNPDHFVFTLSAGQSARIWVHGYEDQGIEAIIYAVIGDLFTEIDSGWTYNRVAVVAVPRVEAQTTFLLYVTNFGSQVHYALEVELDPDGELCSNGDCGPGSHCTADHTCEADPPCYDDTNCRYDETCDIRDNKCYECITDVNCKNRYQGEHCSLDRRCVECVSDPHCDATQRCVGERCLDIACLEDPFEPNDDPLDATPVTEGTREGLLCSGDHDWYVIGVPSDTPLLAKLDFRHAQGDIDLDAYSMQPDGSLQWLTNSRSTTNQEVILADLDADGTVLLNVFLLGDGQPTSYTLTVDLDPNLSACNDGDCLEGLLCHSSGHCLPPPPCYDDTDCPGRRCSPDGQCLMCLEDAHCTNGFCNAGQCVQCRQDTDCSPSTVCIQSRCQPTTCAAEPFEPNDTREQASPLANGYTPGLAICADDVDWFALDANAGESLYVVVKFSHAQGDVDAVLFDPEGNLASASRSVTDNEVLLTRALQDGRHLLLITSFGDGAPYAIDLQRDPDLPLCLDDTGCDADTRCGDAHLCIPALHCDRNPDCRADAPVCDPTSHTCHPCQPDALEPNDSPDLASPLPTEPTDLDTCGGDDWFALDAEAGQLLHVLAEFDHGNGDLDLSLYGPRGEPLASAISTTDDERLTWPVTTTGRHTLRVHGFDGATNAYRLTARTTP